MPMVSHPEEREHSLALRPPPSVSSRTSTITRRHRQNRSHHGGTPYQPQNEFPIFTNTGDVEIIIESGMKEQRYLLHRLILAQSSGFFDAGTSEQWSQAQNQADGVGGHEHSLGRIAESESGSSVSRTSGERKRWRYELDLGSGPDDVPMLVQKNTSSALFGGDYGPRPPPARNKPPASQTSFFRSLSNFSALNMSTQTTTPQEAADDLLRSYDNLFRIFYNYPPTLDSVNIANAYVDCKALLSLADMYDALDVVGPRVDHHLLRFSNRLWKQIAKYPPSYLKLGYLARSRVIFSEALIHVVGQWPAGAGQLRGQLPETVTDLIEDKVDALEEMKCKIEGKLFRVTLTTSRGERVSPSNSYLDWLAMSLFRQWLAENTTPAPVPILKDSPGSRGVLVSTSSSRAHGHHRSTSNHHNDNDTRPPPPQQAVPQRAMQINTGRIYPCLGAGGQAYLSHDELKRFLKLQPDMYTRDNMRRFERRMEEVKNLARECVRPLMRCYLELDLKGEGGDGGRAGGGGGGLPYLTCTRLGEGDMPWED